MRTPLNKKTLSRHFTYHWWLYALIVAGACFFWSILFPMTAYRAPAEKRVDFYYMATTYTGTTVDAWLEEIRVREMPDMEQMEVTALTTDSTYATMQASTYIAASEGDVYMLPTELFRNYAAVGAFIPLEGDSELVSLAVAAGCAVDKGYCTVTETGERHLFGIPAEGLTGFEALGIVPTDTWLCIIRNNGNDENALKLLEIMVRELKEG